MAQSDMELLVIALPRSDFDIAMKALLDQSEVLDDAAADAYADPLSTLGQSKHAAELKAQAAYVRDLRARIVRHSMSVVARPVIKGCPSCHHYADHGDYAICPQCKPDERGAVCGYPYHPDPTFATT